MQAIVFDFDGVFVDTEVLKKVLFWGHLVRVLP